MSRQSVIAPATLVAAAARAPRPRATGMISATSGSHIALHGLSTRKTLLPTASTKRLIVSTSWVRSSAVGPPRIRSCVV